MTGVEIAVAYLAAYAWRKTRRIAGRADALVDQGLDAGMDRLHGLVEARLGADPAWKQLVQAGSHLEAVAVAPRTIERVRLALEDEVEKDPDFGISLQELVEQLQMLEKQSGVRVASVTASGPGSVAVGGDNPGTISTGDGAINIQRR